MRIEGLYNVSNSNSEDFYKNVWNDVNILQNRGQTVEIQYSTNVDGKGVIIYSALIIGRR